MLTGKQIAAKMREARIDTDLELIFGIWPKKKLCHDVMRSSDHLAIRKAASALDRVGDTLVRHLAQERPGSYRTLPEIKPTTRVRKTPERFWLEIDLEEVRGKSAAGEVLFVEFSNTEVRIGIRFPIRATSGKSGLGSAHNSVSKDAIDTGNWQLEQRRPPAEPNACSNDLNIWLSGRVTAHQLKADFQTLSKACPNSRPLMKDILAGLSEASILYETVKGVQVNQTSLAITGLETQHSAMTQI